MRGRRRSFSIGVDASTLLSATGVRNIYTAVLNALRNDARGVEADLLPRVPLLPDARQAALTLQHLGKHFGEFPFDGVQVDPKDDAQWAPLLTLAPYAPHLALRAGWRTQLLESTGGIDSVRLQLLPDQVARVTEGLADLSPAGPGRARLRAT